MFFDWEELEKSIFQCKSAWVLGGGISGESAGKLLKTLGFEVHLLDQKPNSNWDGWASTSVDTNPPEKKPDLLIKSPGILPWHPILKNLRDTLVLSEICLAKLFFKGTIIGITGTDGKSTTTALTAHLLAGTYPETKMGGNIGVPFSSFCREAKGPVVLELSSYQLEDSPPLDVKFSAITNLAEDHLERHGNMENYALAKWKIRSDKKDSVCLTQSKFLKYMPKNSWEIASNLEFFAPPPRGSFWIEENKIRTTKFTYDASQFSLSGSHNLENLAFAIRLCELMAVSPDGIQNRINSFRGLPFRFETCPKEWTKKYPKTKFINDSKATNFHSTLAGLGNPIPNSQLFLILGGIPKKESLDPFFGWWQISKASLFVYGQASKDWKNAIESFALTNQNLTYQLCENLDQVILNLKEQLIPDKANLVIFSPACASFDQFKNFEERGSHFNSLIQGTFGTS